MGNDRQFYPLPGAIQVFGPRTIERTARDRAEDAGWRPPRRRWLAQVYLCRWGHYVPAVWDHCVDCGKHFEPDDFARVHWMETADYLSGEGFERYLAQCDAGDLWVWRTRVTKRTPSQRWSESRWVRFREWNPSHWVTYWRSKRAGKIVMLERGTMER